MVLMIFSDEEKERNRRRRVKSSYLHILDLREGGLLEPEREVRLEFSFESLSPTALESLKDDLATETEYELETRERDEGFFLEGRTPLTIVTFKVIEEWVLWMCAMGERNDCLFTSWNIMVP
ncbi:MAG: hypothetical protein ACYTFG_08400 [Planctomycetota bacterium]|jgi:hypothetical protein